VGTQKTEKFIPVGTVLTVVGELAKSSVSPAGFPALKGPASRLVLRKPLEGPFLATNRSLTQLKDDLSLLSRRLHFWAAALGAVGAALVAFKLGRRAWRDWAVRRSRQRLRKQLAERRRQQAEQGGAEGGAQGGAEGGAEGGGGGGAGEEGEEPSVCTVCLEGRLEVVWVPCGHMCLCQRCMGSVDRCPLCRSGGKPIKVYRP
jgi:hypothetical protein